MQSQTSTLHFYFDFISPYAYFAWRQIPQLCEDHDLELEIHPVVFGKLLDHWGQLGPAEIPPKSRWLKHYCLRYAALHGFEYDPPKYHPYNPVTSLRMALADVSGSEQSEVISAIFEAGWSQGEDLGDPDALIAVLKSRGIFCDNYLERISDLSIKDKLREETDSAIAAGVFGVPTIIIGDQLFWGNDQFDHIKLLLEGKDPIDTDKIAAIETRGRAIERKAFLEKQQKEQS